MIRINVWIMYDDVIAVNYSVPSQYDGVSYVKVEMYFLFAV